MKNVYVIKYYPNADLHEQAKLIAYSENRQEAYDYANELMYEAKIFEAQSLCVDKVESV